MRLRDLGKIWLSGFGPPGRRPLHAAPYASGGAHPSPVAAVDEPRAQTKSGIFHITAQRTFSSSSSKHKELDRIKSSFFKGTSPARRTSLPRTVKPRHSCTTPALLPIPRPSRHAAYAPTLANSLLKGNDGGVRAPGPPSLTAPPRVLSRAPPNHFVTQRRGAYSTPPPSRWPPPLAPPPPPSPPPPCQYARFAPPSSIHPLTHARIHSSTQTYSLIHSHAPIHSLSTLVTAHHVPTRGKGRGQEQLLTNQISLFWF